MTARTTETEVRFLHPFRLSPKDATYPAGLYRVTTDEEEILGLSFIAYITTSVFLDVPSIESTAAISERLQIDRRQLDAAILLDRRLDDVRAGAAPP